MIKFNRKAKFKIESLKSRLLPFVTAALAKGLKTGDFTIARRMVYIYFQLDG